MRTFRNYIFLEGFQGVIDEAKDIVREFQSDEEPYTELVETYQQALECLKFYDYTLVEISQENKELFEKIMLLEDNGDNRFTKTGAIDFLELTRISF
ncbi:hypothetical protein [Lysinibacillus sphaericus]|uniref:hypothetical protein n=1 Tax=Lysinibacillus sphaericus TaxID=1421 RepID=UPI0018CC8633|nr:hypothetical protein [Lysinibacillus sphaericus]